MATTKVFKDGTWVFSNKNYYVYEIKNDVIKKKNLAYYDYPELQLDDGIVNWKIGEFSEMPKTLQEIVGGGQNFNLEFEKGKKGFLSENGDTIFTIPKSAIGIVTIKWVPPEVFQTILDSRENWYQASTIYPISTPG